jgi:hypothetical protein
MAIKRVLLTAITTLFVTACSTAPSTSDLRIERGLVSIPPVGEQATAELGENLISYAFVNERPALRISDQHSYSVCMYSVVVGPQDAKAYKVNNSVGSPIYRLTTTAIDAAGGTRTDTNQNSMYRNSAGEMVFHNALCGSAQPAVNQYEEITVTEAGSGSFRQELIYNGKSGNTVKFIYREFRDDMARVAFTQDATYDLSDSNVIGFKGARINVTEATNSQITYRVLVQFKGL